MRQKNLANFQNPTTFRNLSAKNLLNVDENLSKMSSRIFGEGIVFLDSIYQIEFCKSCKHLTESELHSRRLTFSDIVLELY